MISDLIPNYFQPDELARLKSGEGQRLLKVLYTLWKNVAKADDTYTALDWITLVFESSDEVSITLNEQQNGMQVKELNFALEQTRVVQQFNDQVELERVDMSLSPVWTTVIGLPLGSVGLVSPIDGYFQSNVIQLYFEGKTLEIAMAQEGLAAYQL